ncbi:hypothetical protein HK104_010537 [Borealophlyctis nickersoniae]|nr:hypothetical protein HK104_010537 [Borealophlyctis nickersoniae]
MSDKSETVSSSPPPDSVPKAATDAPKAPQQPQRSTPLWARYKLLIILTHIGAMLFGHAPFLAGSNFPTHRLYSEGKTVPAGLLWTAATVLYSLSYPIASAHWIRTCLGLPFPWSDWKVAYLPAIALAVHTALVDIVPIWAGKWPFPFMPVYTGGLGFNFWPPLVTYLMLPRELRNEDKFWMKFLLSATVPLALDMFWFGTLLFYFVMMIVADVYRILVIIAFKLLTVGFTGMVVAMVHAVVHRNHGHHGDPIGLGGSAKFSIECCYEIFIFFTLSLVESWSAFGIYLAVETVAMTVELVHSQESTGAAFFAIPRAVWRFCWPAGKCVKRVSPETKEKDKGAEGSDEEVGKKEKLKLPGSVWEMHQASKPKVVVSERKDLSPELYGRLVHYILGIQARFYGALAVTLYLPSWYWGPNKGAYIFDFPEYEVPLSILKSWFSVLAALIHFAITAYYLRKVHHVDLVAIWARMAHKSFGAFFASYLLAPVTHCSQMGFEFETVWYLRRMAGLRMETVYQH